MARARKKKPIVTEEGQKKDMYVTSGEWDAEDRELIDWYMNLPEEEYPEIPFYLRPGVRVIDFFLVLKEEIERGPNGPRTRYKALQGDIADLRKYIELKKREQNGN